ncbi:MAG: pyridoxamine 5'-phosphate oxidase family protein [Defluviicoccus sp.]|nr:pyridoxamine 5'-phosphate oxidase family protein [Defluviicoccus sp.]
MTKITDDMKDIISRAILSFVATVNEDGTPNLSPKASLKAHGDKLFFANMASPNTIRNLRANPAIEINVVDVFSRRGYRFRGTAEILPPGTDDYRAIAEWVWEINGREYPVHQVVRIEVEDARPVLSPAYTFGDADEAQLRTAYMPKYGVRPLDSG